MKLITSTEEMNNWSMGERTAGRKIAFVPTMGALHEGHVSLLRMARGLADSLVLSIFVNPTQFGPGEDLGKYPRNLEDDLEKARSVPVNAVFFPTDKTMYPNGFDTFVEAENLSRRLCGVSRPTHFKGVATVVLKLFNIVAPHVAVFGEKDFQQLILIKRMALDLNLPVEIKSHPIVRESDGLAMSSRNAYLSPEERRAALSLSRSLEKADQLIASGEKSPEKILGAVRAEIESERIPKIDYARLVSAETLCDLTEFLRPCLIAIAAFVGKTRLIDNRFFG